MSSNNDHTTSAAASVVVSPRVSYAGATSTTSAPTTWRPLRPSRTARSSRVDQPPGSGVPVAFLYRKGVSFSHLISARLTSEFLVSRALGGGEMGKGGGVRRRRKHE
jgi:hypothetical protein